jgi:hypothetical protein
MNRLLEEDAEIDEDVASVLDGADGDPDIIRENVSASNKQATCMNAVRNLVT